MNDFLSLLRVENEGVNPPAVDSKGTTRGKIDPGLLNWVKELILLRREGRVNDARELKSRIDGEIKRLHLNPDEVYFAFGDPDDPKTRAQSAAPRESIKKLPTLSKITAFLRAEGCGGSNTAFRGIQWNNTPFKGDKNSAFARRKRNAMGESGDDAWGDKHLYSFYSSNGINIYTNADGNLLTIEIDPEIMREYLENNTSGPDDYVDLATLFEDLRITGNTELDFVDPADTGDLTDAPMLGIRGDEDAPILARWAYMSYQVLDPVRELAEHGKIELQGGSLS